MNRFTLLSAALLALLLPLTTLAQGVGTGGAPAASAVLELKSTSQGLLLPRLSLTQRAAIASPVAGLLIFQTDNTPGLYYYNGTAWLNLAVAPVPPLADTVSTLASSGAQGYADGTGSGAQFNQPSGVAYDASGTVYVADLSNNRIRVIK